MLFSPMGAFHQALGAKARIYPTFLSPSVLLLGGVQTLL
jgi:hypothetical protein